MNRTLHKNYCQPCTPSNYRYVAWIGAQNLTFMEAQCVLPSSNSCHSCTLGGSPTTDPSVTHTCRHHHFQHFLPHYFIVFLFIPCDDSPYKGRIHIPKRINFRKSSKWPSTSPPLIFRKSCCGFFPKFMTEVPLYNGKNLQHKFLDWK